MALESKPLFHPEVLRQQMRAFNLPERVADWQPKLQEWASLITSGRADDFKKTALLPDFLASIFCGPFPITAPRGKWPTRTRTPKSVRSLIWMNARNEPQRKALLRF